MRWRNVLQVRQGRATDGKERVDERFVNFSDTCSDSWFTALFVYKIKRSYEEAEHL